MKKKIAFIGGSGFIGSELIRLFSGSANVRNYDIRVPAKPMCETVLVDVRNRHALLEKLEPADWVILLAAEHKDNVLPSSLYFDVNVTGAENVLAAMEAKGIRNILFVSSVSVYGLNRSNPCEEDPAQPFNDYGTSKWQAEEAMRRWQNEQAGNRSLIIVRPTVVFGRGNKGNVHQLLQQFQAGKFVMVGNGKNKKSMAYIENVALFLKYIIDNNFSQYQVYNYADKPDFSTSELVEFVAASFGKKMPFFTIPYFVGFAGAWVLDVVAKLTGKSFPISSVRIQKWCAVTQFSSEKMMRTGFQPAFTLQEGLTKTIAELQNKDAETKPKFMQ